MNHQPGGFRNKVSGFFCGTRANRRELLRVTLLFLLGFGWPINALEVLCFSGDLCL
jgi:hypothetical protein